MIDTIALMLPQNKFAITDHNKFSPSTKGLFEPPFYPLGARSNFLCVQNPTKKEKLEKGYLPRLTVTKRTSERGYQLSLKIELSLPKLMYGNNFQELGTRDLFRVQKKLKETLSYMGVEVSYENLSMANVSSIHYGKNVILRDYSTCSMVMSELQKMDLPVRFDMGSEKFRNEGHVLHLHANSFEIVFYDKIKDLRQAKTNGEKRAIEKDNSIQLNLLDELEKRQKECFEVFRMEVRLGNRVKIKQLFEKLGIAKDLIFQNLFSEAIGKKVLLHFWEEIECKIPVELQIKTEGVFELFESFCMNNPKVKREKLMKLISFAVLGKEKGFRSLRSTLGYTGSATKNRKWYRLKKEFKSLKYCKAGTYQSVDSVSKELRKFERVEEVFCV